MKRHIILICYLLFVCSINLYALEHMRHSNSYKNKNVSIGIKGGFNSAMMFTDKLKYGEQNLTDLQNNYKIGYSTTVFARFNLKNRHFIQPEISYVMSQGSININNLKENATILKDNAIIKTKITSLEAPLLYGYKFIDSYPYGMSFFLGPKISWTIKGQTSCDYSGFYQNNIEETIRPLNFSTVIGLGVNVSRLFFDFRYEVGCNNITKSITYDKVSTPIPYNEKELTLKRRKNILSFSVGIMF